MLKKCGKDLGDDDSAGCARCPDETITKTNHFRKFPVTIIDDVKLLQSDFFIDLAKKRVSAKFASKLLN